MVHRIDPGIVAKNRTKGQEQPGTTNTRSVALAVVKRAPEARTSNDRVFAAVFMRQIRNIMGERRLGNVESEICRANSGLFERGKEMLYLAGVTMRGTSVSQICIRQPWRSMTYPAPRSMMVSPDLKRAAISEPFLSKRAISSCVW